MGAENSNFPKRNLYPKEIYLISMSVNPTGVAFLRCFGIRRSGNVYTCKFYGEPLNIFFMAIISSRSNSIIIVVVVDIVVVVSSLSRNCCMKSSRSRINHIILNLRLENKWIFECVFYIISHPDAYKKTN